MLLYALQWASTRPLSTTSLRRLLISFGLFPGPIQAQLSRPHRHETMQDWAERFIPIPQNPAINERLQSLAVL